MPISMLFYATGASSNAARMSNSLRAASITPICIPNNCSRKSWNANERLPRRGSSRQGLRLAAFAAADDVSAAVQVDRGLRGRADAAGRAADGGWAPSVWIRGGQVCRAGLGSIDAFGSGSAWRRADLLAVTYSVTSELRIAVSASAHDAEC